MALTADNEGAVLLKNTGGLLPLDFDALSSLALIGAARRHADARRVRRRARGGRPTRCPPSAALRARLGYRVHYDERGEHRRGGRGRPATPRWPSWSSPMSRPKGEDRTSLQLPGEQDRLIAAVEAANPRTIVVLETGAAVLMPWLAQTPALLETWYPGETAGTSLADLLSGEVNPSGKLPVSFPVSEAAMPDDTAGHLRGRRRARRSTTTGSTSATAGTRTTRARLRFPSASGCPTPSSTTAACTSPPTTPRGCRSKRPSPTPGVCRGPRSCSAISARRRPPASRRGSCGVSSGSRSPPANPRRSSSSSPPATWPNGPTPSNRGSSRLARYRMWVGGGSDLANLPAQPDAALAAVPLGVNSGPAPVAELRPIVGDTGRIPRELSGLQIAYKPRGTILRLQTVARAVCEPRGGTRVRILVLGGDGYLGWPTAMHLSAAGHDVGVADNFVRRGYDEELGVVEPGPDRVAGRAGPGCGRT